MNEIKQQYNKHLQRFNKACAYLMAEDRIQAEVDKWTPAFNELCRDMSECINEIDKLGIKYEEDELFRGFVE
jgi:hypothetical protein